MLQFNNMACETMQYDLFSVSNVSKIIVQADSSICISHGTSKEFELA